MSNLLSISPIDGRYFNKVKDLSQYFSEYAYFKFRLGVEIKYLQRLLITFSNKNSENIINETNKIFINFNINECIKIKEIEKKINHDVKAIEYYLQEKLEKFNINNYIHLGLTSQDINNTANIIMLKKFTDNILIPTIQEVLTNIKTKILDKDYEQNMIGLTHGQPATLTSMKEYFQVQYYRLNQELYKLINYEFFTKFGGAVGNLNAHKSVYPNIDWNKWVKEFVEEDLKLNLQKYTFQIMNYESLVELFNIISRINSILIDMSVDIWMYISKEYFLYDNKGNVGSSTMPHKINPILFENAEGNLIMANGIFETLSRKLPISRWQRDLTDSTIIRNFGVPFAHSIISYKNLITGLNRIKLNTEKISKDVKKNTLVSSEILQTFLRKYNIPDAYELIKEITQSHDKINIEDLKIIIESFDWCNKIKLDMVNYLENFDR
jgi:adenylosuccinate lyase